MAKTVCQFVIVSDASYFAAGHILLIEDYHCHSSNKNEKSYDPVAFGSRLFPYNQLKFSTYVKEFLIVYFAFEAFEPYVWRITDKPIIVLTDNKSFTRLFQAKQLPGNLWNALDYVPAFKFQSGHMPG